MIEGPTIEEQLAQLAAAGISADDIDAVVDRRIRSRRAEAARHARMFDELALRADVVAGTHVPEKDRHGKGAALTETDIRGYHRVRAAARVVLERLAAPGASMGEFDDVHQDTVAGMVRREAEGKHEENLWLIRNARETVPATTPSHGHRSHDDAALSGSTWPSPANSVRFGGRLDEPTGIPATTSRNDVRRSH